MYFPTICFGLMLSTTLYIFLFLVLRSESLSRLEFAADEQLSITAIALGRTDKASKKNSNKKLHLILTLMEFQTKLTLREINFSLCPVSAKPFLCNGEAGRTHPIHQTHKRKYLRVRWRRYSCGVHSMLPTDLQYKK